MASTQDTSPDHYVSTEHFQSEGACEEFLSERDEALKADREIRHCGEGTLTLLSVSTRLQDMEARFPLN